MKWIAGTLTALALVFAGLYFFAGPAKVEEVDPSAPWAHRASEAEADAAKPEHQADPRKIEDVILQKDYCAAGQYFEGGKNKKQVARALELMFQGEAGKTIAPDDRLILEALLSNDFHDAVRKLRNAKNWQGRMILAMILSGTIDHSRNLVASQPTREQLQEALVAIDQAEDLNWENGWIPVYRYLIMKKRDGDGPGLRQFLHEELAKRSKMQNPFGPALIAFARLRSQDPLFYASTQWLEIGKLPSSVSEGYQALDEQAGKDTELAKTSLRLVNAWHRDSAALVNEGFSRPFVPGMDAADSTRLGAKLWKQLNPNQEIPDRFRETPAEILARMEDRNPSETYRFGWLGGYSKPCGPKWKEAVDNDTELLRDRLRKWDSRP